MKKAAGPALQEQPGHLIRRAQQIAVASFREIVGSGITPIQYALMRVLEAQPGIDQATLAQEAALDTSTTADTAARLEAKGWITREVLPRGQRSLSLTPAGEAVLASLVPDVQRLQRAIFGALDAKEQAEFMRLLGKFVGRAAR